MAQRFSHTGLCVGPVTPMKPNGDLNLEVLPAYIEHLVAAGCNAVFVNGTTAEGLSMTLSERKLVAEKWIEHGRNKFDKIIVHCGALCLRDAQELARHAEKIGADAIAAVPSFYFAPRNSDELTEQIASICAAAPNTPFIYYHTARTHVAMDMAQFIQHAKTRIPNFAGIKWAAPDLAGALKCLSTHGDTVTVMWANDDVLLGALAVGIRSFNGSSYSFTAPIARRIIQAFETGHLKEAQEEQVLLKRIIDVVEMDGNWLQLHKAVIATQTKLSIGPARLPVVPLSDRELKSLESDLSKLNFPAVVRNH